jgi:hypothetical protein
MDPDLQEGNKLSTKNKDNFTSEVLAGGLNDTFTRESL